MTLREVEIVPYQHRWPDEFDAIATSLRGALGRAAVRIDHIGSTSVPGLCAKDVIDLQVTVASLDAALSAPDYDERPEILHDHAPPWWTGDDAEWRKRFFREKSGARRAHVHVRVEGRANQRYALLFRDYLRARPRAADAYGAVKRELAERFGDQENYVLAKDPVCDLIIAGAEDWAAATGWAPGPSDA